MSEMSEMSGRLGGQIILWAVGVLLSVPLLAHHGSASFETGKRVTLKGTVKQWVYSNPHLLLTVDVKGEDGTVVQWLVETQSPNVMYPAGYRKNSFKPGDAVTVIAEPLRDGRPIGRILQVVLANGTTLGFVNDAPIPPPGR